MRREIILDYLDVPNVITRIRIRGRWESKAKEGDGMLEGEFGMMGFEDGRSFSEPRNASSLQKLEEKKK